MLHLKCRKSPYKTADGKEIWEGNLIDLGGNFQFEYYRVECRKAVWYAVAQLGTYIDQNNRLKLLGNMKNARIVEDSVTLTREGAAIA